MDTLNISAIAEAPAMSANGVDVHGNGNFLLVESKEVADTIHGRHSAIISRKYDESLWRAGRYTTFQRIRIFQFLGRVITKKVLARTSMSNTRYHRDYRIKQYLKVRTRFITTVKCRERSG